MVVIGLKLTFYSMDLCSSGINMRRVSMALCCNGLPKANPAALGTTDPQVADFRACTNFGPLYKKYP